MSMSSTTRRRLLQMGGCFSAMGAASGSLALQLAATGNAAAQTASGGYKALICMFLAGGNDSNNTVLATDDDSWGRYIQARDRGSDPIALAPVGTPRRTGVFSARPQDWGGVLPIDVRTPHPVAAGTNASRRTFALHPMLEPLLPIWREGRLGVVANVGPLIQPTSKEQYRRRSVPLPPALMSHNDQQSIWQAGASEGARLGWGGQVADLFLDQNTINPVFTAISTSGNAVFLAGRNVVQYQMSTSATEPAPRFSARNTSLFGSRAASDAFSAIVRADPGSVLGDDYADVVRRSYEAADAVNAAFASGAAAAIPAPTQLVNPVTGQAQSNRLAEQLTAVARMIATAPALGIRRQVFFVQMGGWDNHQDQNTAHPQNLARVAHAMAHFDQILGNVGGQNLRANATLFMASDFSRTFTTNGDGTDHAWGGHYFVMGGAVRGGDVYGRYPTLGVDQNGFDNPDMRGNTMIPTTSVEQMAATLARWFGVGDSELLRIFPRLSNFDARDLGFMDLAVS